MKPNTEIPRYATIPRWTRISGTTRTWTYSAINDGKLKSIKVGRRRLIDVPSGLELLEKLDEKAGA
ncbi:hypothetical protein AiwAL_16895 [Acidiphilium sp. AL]|uniref:hypothetical protein n=1 Tax=Acidiphilium sp. AL TaxID=2871704 RepID=UPI0021CB7B39|nr:hypothetical protein [Acidiphilium sp. AL]MCU4161758.1 hypothetical protein [Acidiphilium sp. AL]